MAGSSVPWDQDCGRRVREAREALGLTQLELARKIGQNNTASLSYIERARRAVSGLVLVRLADALDTSVDWLLGRPVAVESVEGAVQHLTDEGIRRLIVTCRSEQAIRRTERLLGTSYAGE